MTTPRRIVFLGTHGQYNIGDELLLDTFLTQLGAQHHYVVNSYDPAFTRRQLAGRFDVEVIDTAGDRLRLLRELLRCDRVVFGGGSIIKELYASTGRNPYATLLMILAIVTFARRIARKPIAMLNVGVGPLRTPRGLRLARMILSQVDLLTVRDERSVATCREVGVEAVAATDAVFSVDRDFLLGPEGAPSQGSGPHRAPADGESEGEGEDAGRLRVALNLNYDIENPEAWERFLTQLALCFEQLDALHPVELHALPMQAGFKEHDDVTVIDGFARRVPAIPFVRHELTSHVDVARLVASCDVLVSERLHAIVMASILGVPSLVLAYDVKVRELAKGLGIEEWCVDINEPFAGADVAEMLARLVGERGPVSEHLVSRSTELRVAARDNFDTARRWVVR